MKTNLNMEYAAPEMKTVVVKNRCAALCQTSPTTATPAETLNQDIA